MRNSEFWLSVETEADRSSGARRIGPVRVALLFGSMAVAMALLLPPLVAGENARTASRGFDAGIDTIMTGSVSNAGQGNLLTVRRSILQAPGEFCVYDGQGRTQGVC